MPTITTWEGMALEFPDGADRRAISDRLLRATEGLGFTAFRMKKGRLHAAEVVGTIQVGRTRVNVLPKLDAPEETRDRDFLVNLMFAGKYISRPHNGPAMVRSFLADPMEAVIYHAASCIRSAMVQGLPRRYELVAEELATVRGRLDMSQLARRSWQAQTRIPVRHFPLTLDNELARCIKGVVLLLRAAARTVACRQLLDELLRELGDASTRPLTAYSLRALVLSGAEEKWREVIELAKLLLDGGSPDPTFSGANQAFGLLFPPQFLFERAMRTSISEAAKLLSLRASHGGHSKFLFEEVSSGRGVVNMRPDYLLRRDRDVVAVADAKWKRLSSSSRAHGVSREDLYQVAAYQSRYAASKVLMLFPKAAGADPGLIDCYRDPAGSGRVWLIGVDVERLVSPKTVIRNQATLELSRDFGLAMVS